MSGRAVLAPLTVAEHDVIVDQIKEALAACRVYYTLVDYDVTDAATYVDAERAVWAKLSEFTDWSTL